jgi:hypothetical protein
VIDLFASCTYWGCNGRVDWALLSAVAWFFVYMCQWGCIVRGGRIYCGITVVPDMYAFSGLKTFPIYFVTARAHLYGVYVNGNYV